MEVSRDVYHASAPAGDVWTAVRSRFDRSRASASARPFPHRSLLIGAILALLLAAVLVGYFERRAAALQRQQTTVIMQQVCERTATVLAGRVRHQLDAAVLETIEKIGHPQLMDYDLPRVASFFAMGLEHHPYIEQFFLWSAQRSAIFNDQVLFYSPTVRPGEPALAVSSDDGHPLGAFVSQPKFGREIMRLARETAGQRTFVVLERTIDGVPYQVLIHLLWSDERRQDFFGIIGYTVNLQRLHGDLFHKMLARDVRDVLNPDPRSPRLVFSIVDERGRLVYGAPAAAGVPSGSAAVDMLFFPGEPLAPWLASRPPVREWRVVVSAAAAPQEGSWFGGWFVGAVVLLICIAIFCAVTVDRQAVKLAHMQSDFVANVSHQLKTPLSLLSAAIQTLRLERVPPSRLREYLDIAASQTTRLTYLVERILHFSRLDAGTRAYRLEPMDLVVVVETTVERFRAEAQSRQVPIRLESAVRSITVRGDSDALEQVVVNLLENAVKYGDAHNEVVVRVAASNGHAVVSVQDHGTGIHASDLPHVFEKFYRGRNGDRGRTGFGLGLAMVDSIVRAHHGRVRVDTEYGHGSTFHLELPVTSPSAS